MSSWNFPVSGHWRGDLCLAIPTTPTAMPNHPTFPSPRASQAVLRYFRRRVEALDFANPTWVLRAGRDGVVPFYEKIGFIR
jgi:hypothetical protein